MRSDGFRDRSDRWMPDRGDSWGGGKSKGKGKRGFDRSRSPRGDRGGFEGNHWNQGRNGKGGGKSGGKGKGRGKGGKGGKGKGRGKKEAEPMDLDNELDSYFGRAVEKKESKADGAKESKMDDELDAYMSGRKEEDLKKMEERKKRFGIGEPAKDAKKDDEDKEEEKEEKEETAADDKKEDKEDVDYDKKQKELEGLTKDKLTEMCKAAGLKVAGTKADLVERIIEDLKSKDS